MNTEVLVRVDECGAGVERLAELADALRLELLALDVENVTPVRAGNPPPGSRGIDVATAGALLASLKRSAELIGHLVATVRSWLGRGGTSIPRTVELIAGDNALRVTGVSDVQQDRLIAAFISAVART